MNGNSLNVGATSSAVGDFGTLLLWINPGGIFVYPNTWTRFSVLLPNLPAGSTGRIAFRYLGFGPIGPSPYVVGIDDVVYTSASSGVCYGNPITATVIVNTLPTVSISPSSPPLLL